MESQFKFYSLGIVVEDKPNGSAIVMVSPIEQLSIQSPGNIKDKSTKFEGKLKGSSVNFNSEISSTNYTRAIWIPIGNSNRMSVPDVRANETILLFKYGEVDEYYWTTIYFEPGIRKLETLTIGCSNLKGGGTYDKSTSYWTEIDTINKTIKLHTSMNDGEYTEYDITIDTKNGFLEVKDKKNNMFKIDSKKDLITLSSMKDIEINAKRNISLKAENISQVATKSMSTKGGFSQEGDISINGNIRGTANVNINGNINANGTINGSNI